MSDTFPEIKSKHSLVAKYVTEPIWAKLSSAKTETAGKKCYFLSSLISICVLLAGFTLSKAIACAVEFDNQHCGIYAGDWDSYKVRMLTNSLLSHVL